jgi:hypothetical protein
MLQLLLLLLLTLLLILPTLDLQGSVVAPISIMCHDDLFLKAMVAASEIAAEDDPAMLCAVCDHQKAGEVSSGKLNSVRDRNVRGAKRVAREVRP